MPPQSPTTSASPPVPTLIDGNGNTGGTSSPINSPPIILAFLAIAMFIAAMVAVFRWRRTHIHIVGVMTVGQGRADGAEAAFPADDNLKRPIMWEAWIGQAGNSRSVKDVDKGSSAESYGLWENVKPLAVLSASERPKTRPNRTSNFTQTGTNSNPDRTQRPPAPLPPFPSSTLARLDFIRRCTRDQTQGDEVPTPKPGSDVGSSNTSSLQNAAHDGAEEMHITVVIEMPSPAASEHRRRQEEWSGRSELERGKEESPVFPTDAEGVFQYCIGIHTCPWPPKPLTDTHS